MPVNVDVDNNAIVEALTSAGVLLIGSHCEPEALVAGRRVFFALHNDSQMSNQANIDCINMCSIRKTPSQHKDGSLFLTLVGASGRDERMFASTGVEENDGRENELDSLQYVHHCHASSMC